MLTFLLHNTSFFFVNTFLWFSNVSLSLLFVDHFGLLHLALVTIKVSKILYYGIGRCKMWEKTTFVVYYNSQIRMAHPMIQMSREGEIKKIKPQVLLTFSFETIQTILSDRFPIAPPPSSPIWNTKRNMIRMASSCRIPSVLDGSGETLFLLFMSSLVYPKFSRFSYSSPSGCSISLHGWRFARFSCSSPSGCSISLHGWNLHSSSQVTCGLLFTHWDSQDAYGLSSVSVTNPLQWVVETLVRFV